VRITLFIPVWAINNEESEGDEEEEEKEAVIGADSGDNYTSCVLLFRTVCRKRWHSSRARFLKKNPYRAAAQR
jgi:hypothetical protein